MLKNVMSKLYAAIMAFFMMILSWFGIGGGNENKPFDSDSTTAVVTEEQTTQELKTEPESKTVRENPYRTNAAFGCAYTKDREAHDYYPDTNGTELTDGFTLYPGGSSYSNAAQSGYTRTWETSLKIDIKLDAVYTKLYGFEVNYLATDDAGINIPSSVRVFISEDGKNWTKLGNALIPDIKNGTVQKAVLMSEEYVSAEYVRITISGTSAFVFLDELIVLSDTAPKAKQSFSDALGAAYDAYAAPSAPHDGELINKALGKVSLSQGKTYSYLGEAAALFSDDGLKLTDGSTSNAYESGKYVALEARAGQSVTVDLVETVSDIAGVEIEAYSREQSGIYLPCAVVFSAIADDGTNTVLGARYAKQTNNTGVYTFSLELDYTVEARKIRAEFALTPCTDIFLIDEIIVYAHREVTVNPPCYPPVELSLEDNGSWNASEKDYGTYQNLLLGKQSQIMSAFDFNDFQNERNTPASSGLLTDGVHTKNANIYNGFFQIFYSCKNRQVVFELEKISSVNRFTCEFTNYTGWAVYSPSAVKVFISENGCDWFVAGAVSIDSSIDNAVLTGELELEYAVRARYLCFEFEINIYAGCSEIEAFGTKNTESSLSAAEAGMESAHLFKNRRITPSDEILDGAKDTCLLYHSKTFGYTPEMLLPYVAYVDRDGNLTDKMFDSFLFLLSGSFPSGVSSFNDCRLSDWQWCINDLFAPGENIIALEQAAGMAKEALSLPNDYVYPFTVAIYCPSVNQAAFGDIDGDGVDDSMTSVNARAAALRICADMFESKLAEFNFKNIKFCGYYWMNESMDTANKTDEVARRFSNYVHARGLDFIWIPYYSANGFNDWANYGFDCAVLQPNYMFTSDVPLARFDNAAKRSELYGLGIEIEVSSSALISDLYFKRYMEYLSNGVKHGYMEDTISMYYQELLIYYNAAYSDGGIGRLLYENTYGYIKGTLDIYPDTLAPQAFECAANTIFAGALTLPEGLWHEVTLVSQSEHGTVTMNSDGSFAFYPEKNFTGSIELYYTYTQSFEQSEICTAIIVVK